MGFKSTWPENGDVILKKRWAEGVIDKLIAEEIGCCRSHLYKHIKRLRLPRRRSKGSGDMKKTAVISIKVAPAFGRTVRRRAADLGLLQADYIRRLISRDIAVSKMVAQPIVRSP